MHENRLVHLVCQQFEEKNGSEKIYKPLLEEQEPMVDVSGRRQKQKLRQMGFSPFLSHMESLTLSRGMLKCQEIKGSEKETPLVSKSKKLRLARKSCNDVKTATKNKVSRASNRPHSGSSTIGVCKFRIRVPN